MPTLGSGASDCLRAGGPPKADLHLLAAEHNRLRYRLRMQSDFSAERGHVGPGQLSGALPVGTAQPVLAPTHAVRFRPRIGRQGRHRLGVGTGGTDLLVISSADLPERMCRFAFIGHQARGS